MSTSLILKKMKKQGPAAAFKLLFGQIGWTFAGPILRRAYAKRPIEKKRIVFLSKPDYSDNSYYLYRYLRERKTDDEYEYVWLDSSKENLPENDARTKFCKRVSPWHGGLSKEALKAVLTSGTVFFTHDSPFHKLKIREGQTVVNLWHGCGYKMIKSTNEWEKQNPFDYGLVPGKVFVETKSVFWACRKEKILTIGYPRYDEFKKVSDSTKKMLSDLKGSASKLILWMPTYRKTEISRFAVSKMQSVFELPVLTSEEDVKKLDRYCSDGNVVLCVKRHHYQVRYRCEELSLKSIRFIDDSDFRKYDASLYGLLALADGLVTDYSSVAIDYMLVDRPMGFTLDDFNEYRETQGFVFDDPLEYMPGDHIYKYEDLTGFIDEIIEGKDIHREDRLKIMDEVHDPCDDYCGRICERFGL